MDKDNYEPDKNNPCANCSRAGKPYYGDPCKGCVHRNKMRRWSITQN